MVANRSFADLNIMVVDDDDDTRYIAHQLLKKACGFEHIREFTEGRSALDHLMEHPTDVDIIFMDRMMPRMTGLEFCQELRKTPQFSHVDIIVQTGKTAWFEIDEILESQPDYLIRKPFLQEQLTPYFAEAGKRALRRRTFTEALTGKADIMPPQLLTFEARTIAEAPAIAIQLARYFPRPLHVVEAIYELIVNGIEHGNLDMGFSLKRSLLNANTYEQCLRQKEQEAQHQHKTVTIHLHQANNTLFLTLQDQGNGFNHAPYHTLTRYLLVEPFGRGIIKAHRAFDTVEYQGAGNRVMCSYRCSSGSV
ncbi:MAG: response regulator [Alphaproteobacteria bacterium]|nr:response regulator [Alphaproteobacteria bacterium]